MKLLLFDIGNTFIKIALADKNRVLSTYTLPAGGSYTADSFGLTLLELLRHDALDADNIESCVASSVVPNFDPVLREAVTRYIKSPLLYAPDDIRIPLDNRYERPAEVGADRLVGAYAARRLFPDTPSLIIVDFGTAVTFDCVSEQSYIGGLIFPGPATALSALSQKAAKLPTVNLDIRAEEPTPGRNTATSIQHGLVFGFVCMAEGLCARLKRQLSNPVTVIGTGGFAASVARVSRVFDHILPTLIPEGLRRLYFEGKDTL